MRIQRFLTGLVLGTVLVMVLGTLLPVLAQAPPEAPFLVPSETAPAIEVQTPSPDMEPAADPEAPIAPPPPVVPIDIENHWAAKCIRELALYRAIPVDDQARFFPETAVTWADLTTVLNVNLPTDGAYGGAKVAEAALNLPSAVNVLHSYPDHFYAPDRSVTRAEAISAIAAKTDLPYVPRANALLTASLTDGENVPDYGQEGVAAALAARVLVNYPDAQQVEANRVISRGELAALICRVRPESELRSAIALDQIARAQPLPPQPQPASELRGVWLTNIDSNVLFSRENLAAGIQRLKALNINTLYPVVWNFGYPQFPSRTAARFLGRKQRLWPGDNPAFEAAQGDRDMLQEIIELAHAEGMAVIPWFEFGFLAPADYEVLESHPEWFTQRQDGSREIQQGEETFTWMNPFHPRTRQLLLLLMNEVLENYDVEGIQVDDHLGLPVDMGYDPFTVELYRQEHDGEAPPEDYNDPAWMRWRADRVTDFMVQVKRLIELRQPDAILSVSPNPYPFAYRKYLQDWPTWNELGLLDEIIIQVYRDDVDRFVWELNKPAAASTRRDVPTSIGLLSGLRGRPTDADLLTQQLEAVRDRGYAGVSYFFYETLWTPGAETSEDRMNQLAQSFSQAAARP